MKVYEFGPFRLEPAERRLRREGTLLPLTPKALDTLLVLVENAGRAVGKDELMERIWPGISVAEATLAQNIFALRKALGDTPHIETVPRTPSRTSPGMPPPTTACRTRTLCSPAGACCRPGTRFRKPGTPS